MEDKSEYQKEEEEHNMKILENDMGNRTRNIVRSQTKLHFEYVRKIYI